MNLLIDCELTAPPSEIGAFRTLTLYATVFYQLDCLIEAKPEEIDYYYNWYGPCNDKKQSKNQIIESN